MPQFRLTQKYAKDCHISILSDPQPVIHPLDDWFIDVIRVKRKKIAMATHAQSTFTFFIPYAEVGGATAIPDCIGILLKEFLYDHDLSEWAEQVEALFAETTKFCKTVDRKILGHMNDFKRGVDAYTEYSPECVHPLSWEQVANMINDTPVNFAAVGSTYPTEMLGKLIGHPLKRPSRNYSG
jgi:hypothetical protein